MKLHSQSHRRHFLKDAALVIVPCTEHLIGSVCKKWEAVTSEKSLKSDTGQ